jgi:hypothetical protein
MKFPPWFLWSSPLVLGFPGLGSSPSVSGFSGFLLQFWVSLFSGLSPCVMGFFGVVQFWVSVVFYFCRGFSLLFSFCFRFLWSAPSVLGFSELARSMADCAHSCVSCDRNSVWCVNI